MHSQHGILHVLGLRLVVHHGVTQHFGHFLDNHLRHVAVVSAIEHAEQRLVGVEPQLLQYADTQSDASPQHRRSCTTFERIAHDQQINENETASFWETGKNTKKLKQIGALQRGSEALQKTFKI